MLDNLAIEKFDKSFLDFPSLLEEREDAFNNLKEIGIPNKRVENWKYTDLSKLIKNIEFKKGKINLNLSQKESEGIEIYDFSYFINNKDEYIKPIKYLKSEGIVFLNISYATEGRVIEIKKSLPKPLIINISCDGDGITFPRLRINAYPDINAEIHIIYEGGSGFSNQLTEVNLQRNSNIQLHRVNKSSAIHSETLISYLGLNTNLSMINLSMPKNKSRLQVYNIFLDKHSLTNFKSISIPDHDCHDDFLIQNFHMSSNCESDVGIRAILNKGTICSFQALVDVDSKTRSTKAEQDCKAILLHKDASMNAKPEMKIFNDDVICKHGTTIGSLDKDQIFYLKSRGLDNNSAEKILLQGIIKNYISENSPLSNFLPEVYQ